MNDDDKKSIIFLENFFKKNKDNPLKIKQPIKITNYNILGKEEEKIEKSKRNVSEKIRSVNNNYGVIHKKYSIVKESTIFQQLDTKKSFLLLSNLKHHYKNYLYNSLIRNKSLNISKLNSARNNNYIRQKNTLNVNDLYTIKLNNVSIININLLINI